MGFLRSLFIIDETEEVQEVEKTQQETSAQNQTIVSTQSVNTVEYQQSTNTTQPSNQITIQGKIDENYSKMISDLIKANNIEGNDYCELIEIVESKDFARMIPDKKQRILSAFFSLKTQDNTLTKQKILNSIDYYKKLVNDEYNNILSSYDDVMAARINGPKTEIEKLKQERQALNEKIADLNRQISLKETEIMRNTKELNSKKANYAATFSTVINQLENDKNEINSILQ